MKPLLTDELLHGEVNESREPVHHRERNLFEFAQAIWRRRLLVLTILALALLGGVGFILAMPKQYTAQAILQLNSPDTEFAEFEAVVSQQDVDELAVGSEIYVVASYPVALQVVDRLG
ncbi:MAG: Wzz/FepE/Etk N-terminal domain-containing protein, partial [Geminicoccaceae bacterium]